MLAMPLLVLLLLGLSVAPIMPLLPQGDGWFRCGCFGLVLLNHEHYNSVLDVLQQMIRVTQMRGSQSGGLITFRDTFFGTEGIRTRVVNGKRGDLASKLISRFKWDLWGWEHQSAAGPRKIKGPLVFAGHTRFATTSKATLAGTHPHRWSPGTRQAVWTESPAGTGTTMTVQTVETYVCHNGDLDYYEIHGSVKPLEEVRSLVERATGVACTTPVDSVVIAGLIELLRTKGVWQLSLRYALLFKAGSGKPASKFPSINDLALVGEVFNAAYRKCLANRDKTRPTSWFGATAEGRAALCAAVLPDLKGLRGSSEILGLSQQTGDVETPSTGAMEELVSATVDAFFDNDLLQSVQEFLRCARGSFGLSVNCTLDADRETVLAAKGQTMSVAFYPRSGMVLWGSEAAAVKVTSNANRSCLPDAIGPCAACEPAPLMRQPLEPLT